MVQLKRQQQELAAMQKASRVMILTTFMVGRMLRSALRLATKKAVRLRVVS
jgi:hypothetical protein